MPAIHMAPLIHSKDANVALTPTLTHSVEVRVNEQEFQVSPRQAASPVEPGN